MTEENFHYRTSQTILRNEFSGKDRFKMPVIPKFQARSDDFDDLLLIGFDKTRPNDYNHLDRMVHFFLYDYKFERVWKNPDGDIEKLKRYKAVLSPDFSMYLEMAPIMQLYNTFRNRWCGAYFASKGIRVIPTVSWGNEDTFDFCFDGIEKGSAVAVSTYMVSEHGNRQDQKEFFMKGYNELLRRIEPETVICYNTPFPEMQGNIVAVDYELSSWKYMNFSPPKIKEYLMQPTYHSADPVAPYRIDGYDRAIFAGMGSSYGGKWKPKKRRDFRYVGNPGEIKIFINDNNDVYWVKIGDDGYATKERHFTFHNRADQHSNPHDHIIEWVDPDHHPVPSSPINYPDGNAPEFN